MSIIPEKIYSVNTIGKNYPGYKIIPDREKTESKLCLFVKADNANVFVCATRLANSMRQFNLTTFWTSTHSWNI